MGVGRERGGVGGVVWEWIAARPDGSRSVVRQTWVTWSDDMI